METSKGIVAGTDANVDSAPSQWMNMKCVDGFRAWQSERLIAGWHKHKSGLPSVTAASRNKYRDAIESLSRWKRAKELSLEPMQMWTQRRHSG